MSAIKHHGKHHAKHHGKKAAIVFDVDETLLSNYTAIDADNFTYGPQSQAEATNEIGEAIDPSLDLFNLAKQKHITIFLITGRRENTRVHTASNLTREGFTGYKQLVLKPDASTDSTVVYKSGARKTIEKQGYRIVANLGDQYSDLAGGHWELRSNFQPLLLPSVIHVRDWDPAVRSLIAPAGSLPRSRRARCFCDQLREPVGLVPADERPRVGDLDHARVREHGRQSTGSVTGKKRSSGAHAISTGRSNRPSSSALSSSSAGSIAASVRRASRRMPASPRNGLTQLSSTSFGTGLLLSHP